MFGTTKTMEPSRKLYSSWCRFQFIISALVCGYHPQSLRAFGNAEVFPFSQTKVISTLQIGGDAINLVESIDCSSRIRTEAGKQYFAICFSNPLLILEQGRFSSAFGNLIPMVELSSGHLRNITYVGNKANPTTTDDPTGYYRIVISFGDNAPATFKVLITYKGPLSVSKRVDLQYLLSGSSEKVEVEDQPIHDWGPFELRVSCSSDFLLELKQGQGWVEPLNGKASVDIGGGIPVILGVSRYR